VQFVLLLLASAALALFAAATYADSYSHEAELRWALANSLAAGTLFLASGVSLLFTVIRKRPVWHAAVILLVVALAGIGLSIWAGAEMLAATKRRGGDWAGVGVLAAFVFGIACPVLIGLLTLAAGSCLWIVRRQCDFTNELVAATPNALRPG
jgi:hypothetical protein